MPYGHVIPQGPHLARSVDEVNASIPSWRPIINRLLQTHLLITNMISNPALSPYRLKQYVEHMLNQMIKNKDADQTMLDHLSSLKGLQQTYHQHKETLLEEGCAIFNLDLGQFFCLYRHEETIHLHWSLEAKMVTHWTYAHQATIRPLSTLPSSHGLV
jgi:hypothetical protein